MTSIPTRRRRQRISTRSAACTTSFSRRPLGGPVDACSGVRGNSSPARHGSARPGGGRRQFNTEQLGPPAMSTVSSLPPQRTSNEVATRFNRWATQESETKTFPMKSLASLSIGTDRCRCPPIRNRQQHGQFRDEGRLLGPTSRRQLGSYLIKGDHSGQFRLRRNRRPVGRRPAL